MEKILTISVAAYNAAGDIDHCLKSMLNSDVVDMLEIIVINDGSKDNTAEIVHSYELKYPGIVKLINKPNGGHGSTINTSIGIASGKYYRIVDSDDWVDKTGIERLVEWLQNHEVDLVFNPYYEVDALCKCKKKLNVPYAKSQPIGVVQTMESTKGLMLWMHSVVFKTDVVKRMGPIIDENCFYVDAEYVIFPILYVTNFVCLDFPVYMYLLGTESQSMNMNNLISRRNQHLKVVKRLVEFYGKNKKNLSYSMRSAVLHRIRDVALTQYKIYSKTNDSEMVVETREFDKWLREHDEEVYMGMSCKFMLFIKLSRKFHFKFYRATLQAFKLMHIGPK